jgi:hypothetical protein
MAATEIESLIDKIRDQKAAYQQFSSQLLESLNSIWSSCLLCRPHKNRENFRILKEQNDLLVDCMDWMKYKERNKDEIIKQLRNQQKEEAELSQLSQNFDAAIRDGIQHFCKIEFDRSFLRQLNMDLDRQNKDLLSRWKSQRSALYEVCLQPTIELSEC